MLYLLILVVNKINVGVFFHFDALYFIIIVCIKKWDQAEAAAIL